MKYLDTYIKTLNEAWELLLIPFDDKFESKFEPRNILTSFFIPSKNARIMKKLISNLNKSRNKCEKLDMNIVKFEILNTYLNDKTDFKLKLEIPTFNCEKEDEYLDKLEKRFNILGVIKGEKIKKYRKSYIEASRKLYDLICYKKRVLKKEIDKYKVEDKMSDTLDSEPEKKDLFNNNSEQDSQDTESKFKDACIDSEHVFPKRFSLHSCEILHSLLIKHGFIDPNTHVDDLCYVFSLQKDFSKSPQPIKWIKRTVSVNNNRVNRKSLIDLLTLLGYSERLIRGDVGKKYKRLNNCFVLEGGLFKSNDFSSDMKHENIDELLNVKSEYHNELIKIVDQIGMPNRSTIKRDN